MKYRHPLHFIWSSMKQRCNNSNNPAYPNYGGRGICVSTEWENNFQQFLFDMGERPAGMTLERLDNDGNYCVDNCKWGTRMEQTANRRNNCKCVGVCWVSNRNRWRATGLKDYLGYHIEWWDAVCARKSWENKQNKSLTL